MQPPTTVTDGVAFDHDAQHFVGSASIDDVAGALSAPLSVIYQVTRRCNFDCDFCSETTQVPDPSLDEIATIRGNLAETPRVFLSGGEPLLRRDFPEVLDLFDGHIVGVPTNATRGMKLAESLAGRVASVNIGLEGPRSITSRVRGDYDKVIDGALVFRGLGVPLSVSGVVLRSGLASLPFLVQIADVLGAGKVKLIHPIRKGNGLQMPDSEFLGAEESEQLFERLIALKREHRWRPALRMTTWTPETEGYSILIYPHGEAYAWPVFGGRAEGGAQEGPVDKVEKIGDLSIEPIEAVWERYRFKQNHVAKYLGASILVDGHFAG
jgi:MoaA/NifB/PqqE/SkfB family radical SAM enzyme